MFCNVHSAFQETGFEVQLFADPSAISIFFIDSSKLYFKIVNRLERRRVSQTTSDTRGRDDFPNAASKTQYIRRTIYL